jgi:hypothetical protein
MDDSMTAEAQDRAWGPLYRIGAGVALTMLILMPIAVIGFVIAPPPATASDSFALFQRNGLLGLLSLDLIYMFEVLLGGLLLLVLCVALRRISPSLVTVALFLNAIATAIYFASNPAFEMLALSRRHAEAMTDAQKAMFLAAGEGMLATYQGTAYDVSYVVGGLAGLTVAVVMVRSQLFSRATAYLGLAMGLLALIPPTLGTVGLVAAFVYLGPLVAWLVLIARALMRLGGLPIGRVAERRAGPGREQQFVPQQ